MAGDRNNVIKRRDENDWQDFKDEANKNKEGGIGIRKREKKKKSCSFPVQLTKRERLRWKRRERTTSQFKDASTAGRKFLLQREEWQRTNMHLELEKKKGGGGRVRL